MKLFKKILFSILILLSITFISACGASSNDTKYSKLMIFSINDLHGNIEMNDDTYGMAGLTWYVNKARESKDTAVLLLGAGDMFQGTAISNIGYGKNTLELMNDVKFDAMTLGNHEFDWGLEEMFKYLDNNEDNGEADFPFLACNLIQKDINSRPDAIDAYEIVDFNQFQVGIIGYIGMGIEEDIAASKVANYYFDNPITYIENLSKELRNEHGCDLIIVMGHDDSSSMQNQIANLKGDSSVDMIINGHSHAEYTRFLKNGNNISIPVTQAGTACENITETIFDYNDTNNSFTYVETDNIDLGLIEDYDKDVITKINQLKKAIEPIINKELGVASKYVNRTSVTSWTADAIKKNVECDVAALNSGGIRASAFPISENSKITVGKIYEVMPFDNTIKVCSLTGGQLINVLKINDVVYSSNVTKNDNSYFLNGEKIEDTKVYKFACVDYLFDRDEEIYNYAKETIFTGILVRDIMIEQIEEDCLNNKKWLDLI